jgi:hypothetical protein
MHVNGCAFQVFLISNKVLSGKSKKLFSGSRLKVKCVYHGEKSGSIRIFCGR